MTGSEKPKDAPEPERTVREEPKQEPKPRKRLPYVKPPRVLRR